jgi:oxygen-independent coproporphyrinogen-3 oxidase
VSPRPLALYVHWPYCARICPYCDFNVVRARGRTQEPAALAEAILADLAGQAALAEDPRTLVSIFFGGGTPSLMDPAAAGAIVEAAKRLFAPADDLEITLEANPTDAEADRFRAFADAGVQRLSLGVQALDDESLRFLGRNHGAAEARRAATAARNAFPRLSLDLIYARPGQTPATWAEELRQALELGPEHLSPYQLTLEAGTAMTRAAERGRFSPLEEDLGAALFDTTQEVLEAAGFHAYEVSNHARGDSARSRHNLAVWRGAEYLGVGPGAHGRLVIGGVRTATRTAAKIGDYLAAVARSGTALETREPLDPRAVAVERLMLGLRIDEGVSLDEISALGLETAGAPIAGLREMGLLVASEDRLKATAAGRLVLDRIIRELVVGGPD